MLATAKLVSAGMPTSHGRKYLRIRSLPIMSHGCTKTAAPSSSAALKTGKSAESPRDQSLTWLPICTPARPSSVTQRFSSATASSGDCMGSVPSPTKRRGLDATQRAMWSLSIMLRSSASAGCAQ